jgi:hypothetical protein
MTLKVMVGDVQLGSAGGPVSVNSDLFVEGNAKADGSIYQSGGQSSFTVVSVATTAILTQMFKVGPGTVTVLREGRVGFNTTDPAYPLHVVGVPLSLGHASAPELRLQAGNADVLFARYAGGAGAVGTLGVGRPLYLGSQGTDVLYVSSETAAIGVGKTPAQALDVQGNMRVESGELQLPGTPLSIASGGTGANTAIGARDNFLAVNRDGAGVAQWVGQWDINLPVGRGAPSANYLVANGTNSDVGDEFFPKGFDTLLNGRNEADATTGMSLGTESVVEGYVYDDGDNSLISPWGVLSPTPGNTIDFDAAQHTFYLDNTNNRVGIGTNAPGSTMTVVGDLNVSGTLQEGTTSVIPAHAVAFMPGGPCPAGWVELAAAQGYMIVGAPAGVVALGVAGTKFTTNGELLPSHNHDMGDHTHPVDPDTGAGHRHGLASHQHTGFDPDSTGHSHGLSGHTHNVDPDGPGHTHDDVSGKHYHEVDPPLTAPADCSVPSDVAESTASPSNFYGTSLHKHALDIAAFNSGTWNDCWPNECPTGARDISANMGSPSVSISATTDLAAVDFTASAGNTGYDNLSTNTGVPSTNTAGNESVGTTMPYLQMRVCEKL